MPKTLAELEAALDAALNQCESAGCSLTTTQLLILRQALGLVDTPQDSIANPLEALSIEERQLFLSFVREQASQNRSWKTTLLNDWLQGQGSGDVQFLRDRYGIQWLEHIKPIHLADYDGLDESELWKLKVGDRVEVTNGLWEWVQDTGSCSREWFLCTVIGIKDADADSDGQNRHTSCIVRFDSGTEYEIQGIYEWNRPNWRWLS
ncbi:MAG: hypothetical protein DCF22_00385 [Leptolyngbya sp.]|nr:MAG: hypothetical protein DCF22_00385 [Leptolyngbya sp.]